QEIVRMMLSTRSVPVLRLWGTAMERLAEHPVEGFVSTHLTRADVEAHGVKDDEIDGLSNFLSLVTEARTLLVLRETKTGGVKGSMRSISQDVSAVAKAFGGGGIPRAGPAWSKGVRSCILKSTKSSNDMDPKNDSILIPTVIEKTHLGERAYD